MTHSPRISPLGPWPDGRLPLLASESVGTVQSEDAERILGELITAHHLDTTSANDFAASFSSRPVGPIQVIFQQYRSFAAIDITDPLPVIAMTIPLRGDLEVKIDGKRVLIPRGSPLVFNPGDRPRMMGPATADFLTLTMPHSLVRDALDEHFPRLGGADIAFGTVASRRAAGALAQAIWTIQQSVQSGIDTDPTEAERLSDMLVSSLLLSHPHSLTRELYLAGPSASGTAVWDTVSVLRDAPEARITIAELAASAGVSTRSLQTGFLRLIGVTPSEFQRDLRLELARSLIEYPVEGVMSATQLMTRVGYVNQGRFAADYRARFGVTPSRAILDRVR